MDELHPKPVDRVAVRVICGGFSEEFETKSKRFRKTPFKVRKKFPKEMLNCPTFEDLTGNQYGRFTVIGYSSVDKIYNRGHLSYGWVCRCSCGNYEIRLKAELLDKRKKRDRCQECWDLIKAKQYEYWRVNGKDKPLEEFL